MNCKNCGAPLFDGALFCGNCGTNTEESGEERAVTYAKLVKSKKEPTGKVVIKSVKPVNSTEETSIPRKVLQAEPVEDDFSDFVENFAEDTKVETEIAIESIATDQIEAELSAQDDKAVETPNPVPVITPEQEQMYRPMKILDWFVVWLLSCLPVVNLVMLFVWSFGKKVNKSKQSYARFSLILMLAGIVIGVLLFIISFAMGVDLLNYIQK